jgi:hypothetical protein
MTEIARLAAETMQLLAVALPAAKLMANKVEETIATEAGKKLLNWITERFSSSPAAKETLARAVAEPEKPRHLAALQNEIEGLAEDDPTFREELTKHLEAAGAQFRIHNQTQTQTATVTGHGNVTNEITGNNNRVGRL